MVDDILMALSMYFAAAVKQRLLHHGEGVWTLLMLLAAMSLWWRVETACARFKARLGEAAEDLLYDVLFEAVYIISQTVTFLVLQFVVHIFDASVDEQALWMQSVTLPCMLLLFCILLVVVTKRLRARASAVTGASAGGAAGTAAARARDTRRKART